MLYHRIADAGADPQLLCVSPSHFQEHLEVLKGRYPVSALDVVARGLAEKGRFPFRFAAVTFDDGYADNLHNAKPVLEVAGVPATVFISTGYLDGTREMWSDELERILLPTSERGAVAWNVLQASASGSRQERYRLLCEELRSVPEPKRNVVLDGLRKEFHCDPVVRPSHRFMTPDEVVELARGGLIDVGAHCVSHTLLSALSVAEQEREIAGSRVRLEALMSRPVTALSYPFGYRGSYTAETVRLARESGFHLACANFPGLVTRGTSPFEMPRFLVRDWDGDEFARRLDGFFRG
ncbi:MAG TPA: polysaccharide deacetylase family protein [Planctomycetota bacterium]|nr:polysaccharide deacetylase family protein [Planctomycetota bacterium]